jgi:hypothetical protein
LIYLFSLLPLLFTSCYFQEFDGVRKNSIHERLFENSGQGKIVGFDGGEIADIKVVYLSDISKTFKKEDVFLFSIYVYDKNLQEELIGKIRRDILLNKIRALKTERVKSTSKAIKLIRTSNPWYENLIIHFDKQEEELLELDIYLRDYRYTKIKILKGSGEKRLYPTILEKLQRDKEKN